MASVELPQAQCSLKKCLENPTGQLEKGCAKVETRAFELKRRPRDTIVDWQPGGLATFHRVCWMALVKATKNRTSPIILSDLERSMILDASKTAEHFDSDQCLSNKAEKIATILKNANYCIAFTGAGISTAAGIGDFRGKDGKWTEKDKLKNYGSFMRNKPSGKFLEELRPTYTHEALVKLVELGYLKFVISQNTDGLHRLSGLEEDLISELHGNAFVERCEDCDARYEHPSACRGVFAGTASKRCAKCGISHRTGRKCLRQGCDGFLMNTIINFGDYLESSVLGRAREEAEKSDSVLVLGSTLMVSPANDLVTAGQQPHRIIICNRQTTPYDSECQSRGPDLQPLGSRVFGDCDKLMRHVMSHLLEPAALKAWEQGREARCAGYNLKRIAVR